jgi:hypothetical protein
VQFKDDRGAARRCRRCATRVQHVDAEHGAHVGRCPTYADGTNGNL